MEIENSLGAWAMEKSEDFGVVLVEMLGGDHQMDMKPGDYMYLRRSHHRLARSRARDQVESASGPVGAQDRRSL